MPVPSPVRAFSMMTTQSSRTLLINTVSADGSTLLNLSVPPHRLQYLIGPSGCGKSKILNQLYKLDAAVRTELSLLSEAVLAAPEKRPAGVTAVNIPPVYYIGPEALTSLPATLFSMWNGNLLVDELFKEITNWPCPRCDGTIALTTVAEFPEKILKQFPATLLALSISIELPSGPIEDAALPLTGRILYGNALYQLDDEAERKELLKTTGDRKNQVLLYVYDRLRVTEETKGRLKAPLEQNEFNVCVFPLDNFSDVHWYSEKGICEKCGFKEVNSKTVHSKEGSFAPGLSIANALNLPFCELEKILSQGHPFFQMVNGACILNLGNRTLLTAPQDLPFLELLSALILRENQDEFELLLIDSFLTLGGEQDWTQFVSALRNYLSENRRCLISDSRFLKETDEPVINYPVAGLKTGNRDFPLLPVRRKVPLQPLTLAAGPELEPGHFYQISADAFSSADFFALISSLTKDKNLHRQPLISSQLLPFKKPGKQTVADFLGVTRSLHDLFAATTEAKMAGLKAKDFGSPSISIVKTIRYSGFTLFELLEMEIGEAAKVLGTIPDPGTILSLSAFLGLDNLPLLQLASDLSTGELQRLRLIKALTGKALPFYAFLEFPGWCLNEEALASVKILFDKITERGGTIVILDSYNWQARDLRA